MGTSLVSDATVPASGDSAMGAHALEAGTLVGEYELTGELGRGGFGSVYSAVHPLIGKPAAVKVLHPEFSASAEMVSRFVAEARAVNTIRHQNIIDIFNFGQLDDGRHYFVMELLDGSSFDRFIEEEGPLEPVLVLKILRGVAKALDAAHAKGIVHRDLKPDNIFLTFDDEGAPVPKLLDFGIAKLLGEAGEASRHHTQTGAPVGTPHYMAPEQCLGDPVNERVDIYAFGVVAFEALTGEPPFMGRNFLEIMNKQTSAERPAVSERAGGGLAPFDAPIQRMMACAQADRPATLVDCYASLEAAARKAGYDVEAPFVLHPRERRSSVTGQGTGVGQGVASADTQVSSLSEAPAPGGGSRHAFLLIAGVVVIGVAAYLAVGDMTAAEPAAASASVDASAEPIASNAPAPVVASAPNAEPRGSASASAEAAAPFRVAIAVRPASARIDVSLDEGGATLSGDGGVYEIPGAAGDRVTLKIRAPGFAPATSTVVLSEDDELSLTLRPLPTLNDDLEDPF